LTPPARAAGLRVTPTDVKGLREGLATAIILVMYRVTYAGETFLTGQALGDTVLSYARELALKDRADTVEIPGLLEDGSPTLVEMLIGPASQIVMTVVDSDHDEPIDESTVADLTRRLESLNASNAVPMSQTDVEQYPLDIDYE
jgi:hypothetical protein